jgi:hypothetical protein
MRHDDRVFIAHMVDFARKAHERVASRERADLDGDEDLQLQLYALIERIGGPQRTCRRPSASSTPRCLGRTSSGCATS